MKLLTAFASGLVFGLGLILSRMSDPLKVLAFLDVIGNWDPSLAFVMVGAIATAALGFAVAARRRVTWTGEPLALPPRRSIDGPLLVGSALFGAGWGLSGFCPGPGLVGLGAAYLPACTFVIAMFFGMEAHAWYDEVRNQNTTPDSVGDN